MAKMTTDREALDAIQLLIEDVENKYGDPHTLRHAKAALAALSARSGGQPDMVSVPREPTIDMLVALTGEWHPSHHSKMRERYKAMLAAAKEGKK